jgi:hypothetical protein
MALVGAAIVFSGLIVLSFTIAQLHKVLILFDKKQKPVGSQPSVAAAPPEASGSVDVLMDMATLTVAYDALANELGESFLLAELYALALRDDLPHPHLSIRTLREARVLLPQGDGLFAWHDSRNA